MEMLKSAFLIGVGITMTCSMAYAVKSKYWFGGEVCIQKSANESTCYNVTGKLDGDTIMIYAANDGLPHAHGWLVRATVEQGKEK
jgi:hypothetical protein